MARNPLRIPLRDQVRCDDCEEIIDAKRPGVCRLATGWIINREGGGANMIALPVYANHWLCAACLDERRRVADQLSLFG